MIVECNVFARRYQGSEKRSGFELDEDTYSDK